MKFPRRLLHTMLRCRRLRPQINQTAACLDITLGQRVCLRPVRSAQGGRDLLLHAVCADGPSSGQIMACVRLTDARSTQAPNEPDLPRCATDGASRLQNEAAAYRQLAPHRLSPAVIATDTQFLANSWLPWPRLSDLLRSDPAKLGDLLPTCLQAIRHMHDLGVVHLDLNCGNVLVNPAKREVALIDFEYTAAPHLARPACMAFDYIRFAHNLLKRRRGLEFAMRDPAAFVRAFETAVTGLHLEGSELPLSCFERIRQHPILHAAFQRLLNMESDTDNKNTIPAAAVFNNGHGLPDAVPDRQMRRAAGSLAGPCG